MVKCKARPETFTPAARTLRLRGIATSKTLDFQTSMIQSLRPANRFAHTEMLSSIPAFGYACVQLESDRGTWEKSMEGVIIKV